jgi:AraC-like DNA-binding protein
MTARHIQSLNRAHFGSFALSRGAFAMHLDLFDARVLEPLVTFLQRHGARAESFLDRAHIPNELIAEGGWVAKKQAYDFTLDVVQRTRCQDAVFEAYLSFEFEHLGPIAEAMKSCKTVKEALEVGARLGSTSYEGSEYFLKIDGDTTWFCYREPHVVSAGQTFINDMTLMIYHHLIRITANEDWRPERMLTQGQVIDRHRTVENFEDCQVSFHANFSALGFPTKFLRRRLPWQQPKCGFDESEAWQFGPEGSAPVVDALYRLIASRFPYDQLPTLEMVARMTGVSAATLKRQLASAGVTYRGLLDRLRFDAACEMLSMPEISVKAIAHELGYSGTNNFVRSFHRMTGMSPGEYRRRQMFDVSEGRNSTKVPPLLGTSRLRKREEARGGVF